MAHGPLVIIQLTLLMISMLGKHFGRPGFKIIYFLPDFIFHANCLSPICCLLICLENADS